MRDEDGSFQKMVGRSLTHHQPELAGEGAGHTHTHSSRQFDLVPCCLCYQLSHMYQLCSLSTLVVQDTVWQMHRIVQQMSTSPQIHFLRKLCLE